MQPTRWETKTSMTFMTPLHPPPWSAHATPLPCHDQGTLQSINSALYSPYSQTPCIWKEKLSRPRCVLVWVSVWVSLVVLYWRRLTHGHKIFSYFFFSMSMFSYWSIFHLEISMIGYAYCFFFI